MFVNGLFFQRTLDIIKIVPDQLCHFRQGGFFMKRIIVVLILISYVFTFTIPAYASLSWTCSNCGQTYYFDDRDSDYMNNWIPIHENACRGGSSSSYSSDSSYSSGSHRPSSVQGAFLLGGLVGGTLGGIVGLAYSSQPDLLAYVAAGAFIGAIAVGLLWIVSEGG